MKDTLREAIEEILCPHMNGDKLEIIATSQILSLLEGSLPKELRLETIDPYEDGWNACLQEIKNNLKGEK